MRSGVAEAGEAALPALTLTQVQTSTALLSGHCTHTHTHTHTQVLSEAVEELSVIGGGGGGVHTPGVAGLLGSAAAAQDLVPDHQVVFSIALDREVS